MLALPRAVAISASLMAADFAALGQAARDAERGGAHAIHIDVFDGHYAHNLSFGIDLLPALRRWTALPLVAHLMLSNVDDMLADFARAGADMIVVPGDACPDPGATLAAIRALGVKAGLAVNPGRPLERAWPFLPQLDQLLILAVTPGWGGQRFDEAALPRLAEARARIDRLGLPISLCIDGGVNRTTIPAVLEAGAGTLVIGSAIFAGGKTAENLSGLRRLIAEAGGLVRERNCP